MAIGFLHGRKTQTGEGGGGLHGTLTMTGSYRSSVGSGWIGSNADEETVLVIVQAGTDLSYENLNFDEGTIPAGVTLQCHSITWDDSNRGGVYFGFILTGVTGVLNVTVNWAYRTTTYDFVRGTVSAAYA